MRGMMALPRVISAARKGDDGLLRALLAEFEMEGFVIEGAHEVVDDLTLPVGVLGAVVPEASDKADIARAIEVARAIGRMDIGQGAVVVRGLVLAVEGQEGTDAMLARCADLPKALRVGETGEAAFDRAIEHVIADLDAQSAEKLGGNFVFKSEIAPILCDDAVGGARAFFEVEQCGAFDDRMFAFRLQSHQAFQGDQDALVVAWFLRDQLLDRGAARHRHARYCRAGAR
jgi:hypothetical protein